MSLKNKNLSHRPSRGEQIDVDDLIARDVLAIKRVGDWATRGAVDGSRWWIFMERGDKTQFPIKIKVLAKIKHLDRVERRVLFWQLSIRGKIESLQERKRVQRLQRVLYKEVYEKGLSRDNSYFWWQ